MRQGRFAFAVMALAAIAFTGSQAAAQGVRDRLVQTIIDSTKAGGAKDVAFERVVGDDTNFTIEGLTFTIEIEQQGTKKDATARMATLAVAGAAPTADGGYTATEMVGQGFEMQTDEATVTIARFRGAAITEPPPAKIKPEQIFAPGRRFTRIEVSDIVVEPEDGARVTVQSIAMDASDWAESMPRKSAFQIAGIAIPVDDMEQADQLKALGYESITLDIDTAGTWDDKTGLTTLSDLAFTARDMGVFRLSGVVGGLTPALIEKLQILKPEENDKALELLQGLTIGSLTITFENRSIVEKGLEFAAKQQGVRPQDLIDQANAALPALLTFINDKPFEAKVSRAVAAFLASPKSLVIRATPAQPLPVSQIVGTVLTAPQTLPSLLGADVVANP